MNSSAHPPAPPHSTELALAGRVALVFGAGSCAPGWGNGKATAVTYARAGATVIAIDIREDAALETQALIQAEGGLCEVAVCDVTSSPGVKAVVDGVMQRHGRIDVLHNNVGITDMGGVLVETEENWQRILNTNLTSAFITCKHTLPHMIACGKGAIVNVSSLAAIRYAYPYASYQASKAGLNQLTQSIAIQHASQGIRANVIMPGLMDTPLVYQQIAGQYGSVDEMRAARASKPPMARQGTGWDIAQAALFLASDASAYITGVCLPVDGGLSCVSN